MPPRKRSSVNTSILLHGLRSHRWGGGGVGMVCVPLAVVAVAHMHAHLEMGGYMGVGVSVWVCRGGEGGEGGVSW